MFASIKSSCYVFSFASLLAAAVFAETPLLDLADAAKRSGETVSFAAEVKGVAHSAKSDATYLNFGDAYPRQVLSVLISKENQGILSKLPRLYGRTVRITGLVETTSRGPVIRITNASQIQLAEGPGEDVLTSDGDGVEFSTRFEEAVATLFAADDFAALESLATRLREKKERFLDGRWKLAFYFEGLAPHRNYTIQEWSDYGGRVGAWKQAFPESIIPAMLAAKVKIEKAWAARGTGYADTVTPAGGKEYDRLIEEARILLEAVREHRDASPQWFAEMQGIALAQGWSRKKMDELFEAAVAKEPEYHRFYTGRAFSLLPRWYGEPGEWETFAAGLVDRFPGGLGDELYARIVWRLASYYKPLFKESAVSWPLLKNGFEELRRRYPESLWTLNEYASLAVKADDRETARRLFKEINGRFQMSVWTTWDNVANAKNWVDRNP